jgi:hypothetical protein
MIRLAKIAVACALLVAAIYVCISLIYRQYLVRFRLTFEVQDGDQIRTGSSVLEVEYPLGPDSFRSLGRSDSFRRVIGKAVTVDLGAKGLLFMTFGNAGRTQQQVVESNERIICLLDQIACLPFAAYAKPGSLPVNLIPSEQEAALHQLLRQSGPRDVPFVALPQLVTFSDINDKGTERIVSPFDLSASFGPGVALMRVVLELTRDAITPEPPTWPQWLKVKGQNTTFRGDEHGQPGE